MQAPAVINEGIDVGIKPGLIPAATAPIMRLAGSVRTEIACRGTQAINCQVYANIELPLYSQLHKTLTQEALKGGCRY